MIRSHTAGFFTMPPEILDLTYLTYDRTLDSLLPSSFRESERAFGCLLTRRLPRQAPSDLLFTIDYIHTGRGGFYGHGHWPSSQVLIVKKLARLSSYATR